MWRTWTIAASAPAGSSDAGGRPTLRLRTVGAGRSRAGAMGARHRRMVLLPALLPALLSALFLARPLRAQVADTLRGRVLLPDSTPAVGAEVRVTPMGGDASISDTTDSTGAFAVAIPGAEAYLIVAELKGYPATRTGTSIRDPDWRNVLVRLAPPGTAMLDPVVVRTRQRPMKPDAVRMQDRGGEPFPAAVGGFVSPGDAGSVEAQAGRDAGVVTGPGGISVHGLPTEQTVVTLNGVPVPISSIPPGAMSARLATTTYDPSRGGFSGGQVALRPGFTALVYSNRIGTTLDLPSLQFTDPASARLGQEYTNLQFNGRHAGPLVDGKSRFSVQYDVGRRFTDLATLASADPRALARAGVAPDSVLRLLAILDDLGVPLTNGAVPEHQSTDQGSVVLGLESWPSTYGNASSLLFHGGWNRSRGLALGPTVVPAAGSGQDQFSGVLQGQRLKYVGEVLHASMATFSTSASRSRPYTTLPSGTVTIASDSGGVSVFRFGGAPLPPSSSRTLSADLRHSVSWRTLDNEHGLNLAGELRWDRSSSRTADELGSFVFQSLEQLATSDASSLVRTMGRPERELDALTAALSFSDAWNRRVGRIHMLFAQAGVRVEGMRFGTRPVHNPLVEDLFGRRTDQAPAAFGISPRAGFTWHKGGDGTSPTSLWSHITQRLQNVYGGVGLYVNSLPSSLLASVMDATGLPDGAQRLHCVGDAAPDAAWREYLDDPTRIPIACADGTTGTTFADRSPRVELFAPGYSPPRTWRGELGTSYMLRGRSEGLELYLHGSALISRSEAQPSPVDLNFADAARFTLPDEDGRPVFADPDDIVPGTGTPAPGAARRSDQFGTVLEHRSDLRASSEMYSLTLRGGWIRHTQYPRAWLTGAVTWSHLRARSEARGTSAPTVGHPNLAAWGDAAVPRNSITASLTATHPRRGTLSLYGRMSSGMPFTPLVLGDVNADGRYNDPAFIADPRTTGDSTMRADMLRLLQRVPAAVRECLERQFGGAARRNSCTGPWSASLDASASLDLRFLGLRRGSRANFSFVDLLGGLDRLLNGSDTRGWGRHVAPDPYLLAVRGFDPVARRYRYDVNQRFGDTRSNRSIFRSPFRIVTSLTLPIGPDENRQLLRHAISKVENGRRVPRSAEEIRRNFAQQGSIAPHLVFRRDSVLLTDAQVERLQEIERRYEAAMDSLWRPASEKLAALPPPIDEDAIVTIVQATRIAERELRLNYIGWIRETLTSAQLEKLPSYIEYMLDPDSVPEVEDLDSRERMFIFW